MIGLGCMRLSTRADRDDERGLAVIRAALDAGATLLDTADAYCLDDRDTGHNERLIARALDGWAGDRARITVATKAGCAARTARGFPMAARSTSATPATRAGARLRRRDDRPLSAARRRPEDADRDQHPRPRAPSGRRQDPRRRTVQRHREPNPRGAVGGADCLRPGEPLTLDDESLRNGSPNTAATTASASSPTAPRRRAVKQLARDAVLSRNRREAWRLQRGGRTRLARELRRHCRADPGPHATRERVVARASGRRRPRQRRPERARRPASGRLLRVPRADAAAAGRCRRDVVLVMGIPGAGKTAVARALESDGYERLNRDECGGSLADLVPRLDEMLVGGHRRVVLDNTYPARRSRNEVIETAWQRGAPARCIWLTTDVPNAQINAIRRMLDVHGALPTPEEIRERSRRDTRYLLPDAQFRYERTLEPPTVDEGFTSVDAREFVRDPEEAEARALIFDFDDLLGHAAPVLRAGDVAIEPTRLDVLRRHRDQGLLLFVLAWRPQVARSQTTLLAVEACFARRRELVGGWSIRMLPPDAGPPSAGAASRSPAPSSSSRRAATSRSPGRSLSGPRPRTGRWPSGSGHGSRRRRRSFCNAARAVSPRPGASPPAEARRHGRTRCSCVAVRVMMLHLRQRGGGCAHCRTDTCDADIATTPAPVSGALACGDRDFTCHPVESLIPTCAAPPESVRVFHWSCRGDAPRHGCRIGA